VTETSKHLLLASSPLLRSAQRLVTNYNWFTFTLTTVWSSANPGFHLLAPRTAAREMIHSAQYSERN
jgi:hypothetical protein